LSIWDTFTADGVLDGSTGQTACNSYKYYQKDVDALKSLGVINWFNAIIQNALKYQFIVILGVSLSI